MNESEARIVTKVFFVPKCNTCHLIATLILSSIWFDNYR